MTKFFISISLVLSCLSTTLFSVTLNQLQKKGVCFDDTLTDDDFKILSERPLSNSRYHAKFYSFELENIKDKAKPLNFLKDDLLNSTKDKVKAISTIEKSWLRYKSQKHYYFKNSQNEILASIYISQLKDLSQVLYIKSCREWLDSNYTNLDKFINKETIPFILSYIKFNHLNINQMLKSPNIIWEILYLADLWQINKLENQIFKIFEYLSAKYDLYASLECKNTNEIIEKLSLNPEKWSEILNKFNTQHNGQCCIYELQYLNAKRIAPILNMAINIKENPSIIEAIQTIKWELENSVFPEAISKEINRLKSRKFKLLNKYKKEAGKFYLSHKLNAIIIIAHHDKIEDIKMFISHLDNPN